MKKFKFYNITPLFAQDTAFVVDNVRRLRRETGLDCVAFCLSMHPQGTPAAVHAATTLAAYREVRRALAGETGLEIGVLVQSTLGHGWSGRRQITDEPWQRIVMQDGAVSSRMCPSDERFRRYILDAIGELAATKPSFLLIDDDFGLRTGECFCPAHLAELNAAAGTQFKTPNEAQAALAACDPAAPLLWTWESLRIDLSRRFAREIREAIDRHDPAIRCGYCTPYMGYVFSEAIAKLLAGGTEPLVRIANAYYLSTNTQSLPAMAGVNAKARAAVASIREVLDESDTFPHTRFSESATALHAHLTSAILDGLTSSKLWIADFTRPNPGGCREYERIVARNRRFYDALLTAVDGIQWQGFVQPIPAFARNYNPLNPIALLRQPDYATSLLCRFGIPFAYERSDRKTLRMLCGANVDSFTDEELLEFLKGGLLLDTVAAEKLQARGFARHLGCTVEKDENGLFTQEVVVETGVAYRSLGAHDVRRIVPASPETRVVTWLHNGASPSDANRYGPGSTCFVNEFGARIVVSSFSPQQPPHILFAHGRREVLVAILDALSGGAMPLRADESQDVCARCGRMPDGGALLALFNANLDPLEGVHLLASAPIAAAQRLGSDGAWHDVPLAAEGEGRYRLDVRLEIAVPGIFRLA
jgi:hypothetical protein